jgi:Transcriptional regulator/sugar kinase
MGDVMKTIAIGVDVGGSHVSCAACDISERRYLPETFSENDLNNQAPADEIIGIWAKTIQSTIDKVGIKNLSGIGFAMPGPFDYANGIAKFDSSVRKYESLYNVNVAEALKKMLNLPDSFPVRFINDATAFAIGEDWLGKSAGSSRSMAITLGTGFGSAFLGDRLPVISGNEVPKGGCVWHIPFENGIADDYFSTRGFLHRYYEKTGVQIKGVKEITMKVDSDSAAKSLFDDFGYKLGLFLHPWMEKFGVEVLVIGGNISNAFPLFGERMKAYLKAMGSNVRIEISELKESAAMIGSAVLVNDTYFEKILPLLSAM